MHQKSVKYTKIVTENHNYMLGNDVASINLFWNKTRFFLSPFLVTTNRFLVLAEASRNHLVTGCSTALRSATEENQTGGYITVPCSSRMTQRSSTLGWIRF